MISHVQISHELGPQSGGNPGFYPPPVFVPREPGPVIHKGGPTYGNTPGTGTISGSNGTGPIQISNEPPPIIGRINIPHEPPPQFGPPPKIPPRVYNVPDAPKANGSGGFRITFPVRHRLPIVQDNLHPTEEPISVHPIFSRGFGFPE